MNFSFSHDTPSRIPLLYHNHHPSPPPPPPPSPPLTLAVLLFAAYLCLGAATFVCFGWDFSDALYFCFVAVSTIGIEEQLPTTSQLFICAVYLFVGLIVVAMCFSLVHDEVNLKCKQFAVSFRH